MATNPMQKKARNSFILGILVTVVVMGLIVALLLVQLMKIKEEEEERQARLVSVYALNTDVKSGDTIDISMLSKVTTEASASPKNAASLGVITENTIAKIDLTAGTIITEQMLTESDNILTNDVRVQEYNMLKLATQITSDDYIDIRLRMPSGLDYIVVSKKRVEVPQIDGVESLNTIWVKLTEDETLAMSNAIVEAYKMEGAILYTTKYVEPGTQEKATPTYVPSAETVNLITQNPNVVEEAKQAMYKRYNDYTSIRNNINAEVSRIEADDAESNVKSSVTEEVTKAQEQRQSYLDALAGY
ncbi:MAG: hypothetical protein ACI4VQ_02725 [Clostridia bacterium]